MRIRLLLTSLAVLALTVSGITYSTFAKWASTSVTFYVNPNNADVSSTSAANALQFAMDVWNKDGGSPFRYVYGGTVGDTSNAYDNRNVILFRNVSNASTIATTYSWWDSSNRLLDSDIVIWDGGFTFFTGTSGCGGSNGAYLEDIATHELGHALGLNHSSYTDATMYPSYGYCSQEFRTLASDDIAGIRSLYGTAGGGGGSNTAPTVVITSPPNGATYSQGTAITLAASASDTQDGNLSTSVQWTDNGASVGAGASFQVTPSGTGTHTYVARVTDSGGLQGSSQVSITVISAASSNTAPAVTITSPKNGSSYNSGVAIWLSVSAWDSQDGNVVSKVQWTDNGVVAGVGEWVSIVLSGGSHTFVARVTDSGGLQGSSQVTITVGGGGNTAPTVVITSPTNGAAYGQGTATTLAASASDVQDGDLSSRIQWTDNGVVIGTGAFIPVTLGSAGSHTYVARVTDSGGLAASSQVSISVTGGTSNTTPVVVITSPRNAASYNGGTAIWLSAGAWDSEDGNVVSRVQWTDNGVVVGAGEWVSIVLSTGTHTFVARVTDSGGLQATSQVTVTVY